MNTNKKTNKIKTDKIIIALIIVFATLTALTTGMYAWRYSPGEARGGNVKSHKNHDSTAFFARYLRRSFKLAEKQLFEAYFILEQGEQIKLSGKQRQKIENIMMTYQESTIRISAEIKILELRFASDIRSEGADKIDKKKMANHIRLISKQKTDWVVIYINYLLDLRQVLSSEQLDQLTQISRERQKKRLKKKRLPPSKEPPASENSAK